MSRCTLGLGRAAVFVLPQLLRGTGLTALVLVAAGGLLYTLGGVTYALRRPDPWPRFRCARRLVADMVACICRTASLSCDRAGRRLTRGDVRLLPAARPDCLP